MYDIYLDNTTSASYKLFYCAQKGKPCSNTNQNGYCALTACSLHDYNQCDIIEANKQEINMIEYTNRWKGFQFRSPVYLGDSHIDEYKFDLVKWQDDSCFFVGALIWDPKEGAFEFESCGLRYLEYSIKGLNEWVLAFARIKERELRVKDD